MDGWFLSFVALAKLFVRLQDSGGALVTCGLELVGKALVAHSHDLDGKDGGVFRPVDSDGGNGDAARHLDGREQRVHAVELRAAARHADDGKRRIRGHRAGQVRGHARERDDTRKSALPCRRCKFSCLVRAPVGG